MQEMRRAFESYRPARAMERIKRTRNCLELREPGASPDARCAHTKVAKDAWASSHWYGLTGVRPRQFVASRVNSAAVSVPGKNLAPMTRLARVNSPVRDYFITMI